MNQEQQNETPTTPDLSGEEMKMPENSTPISEPTEKEITVLKGPVLVVIVALLLAILVGLFMWNRLMSTGPVTPQPIEPIIERPTPEENNEPESTTAESQTDDLETVSTSDEISAIEADIEATNLEALDAELEAIEAELDAAL